MGDFNVKPIRDNESRTQFYSRILEDIDAFSIMFKEGMLENRDDRIGAEQEITIVDENGYPSPKALSILKGLPLKEFTNELALFNLEANLDPVLLKGSCFSDIEKHLLRLLDSGQNFAHAHGSHLFLTGILPTINYRHLDYKYMTPEPRYKELSQELLRIRGTDFEIYLQGVDFLNSALDTVLFEACNTSFQLHLQVPPQEFVRKYNWAQMISGPVLSAATNSPLLFGKELWAETRIALFKQSLDTRSQRNYSRNILSRVHFGNEWIKESPVEIWEQEAFRFPLLVMNDLKEDPITAIQKGVMPKLSSVKLHNGTTYTWNRLCYGVKDNVPHIRIECRYLPAGPSVIDEIANFVFWIGLMHGIPDELDEFWKNVNFRVAKSNFIRAARMGLECVFNWFGKSISAHDLILNVLLPLAVNGLKKMHVDEKDINHYLSVIEKRVNSGMTGSKWLTSMNDQLRKKHTKSLAAKHLVLESLFNQKENIPVSEWKLTQTQKHILIGDKTSLLVEDIMQDDVITLKDNMPLKLAWSIMKSAGFNHLPVENANGKLVGVVSMKLLLSQPQATKLVEDCMVKNVFTITPFSTVHEAQKIMNRNEINCLPVVEGQQLVGLITSTDIDRIQSAVILGNHKE